MAEQENWTNEAMMAWSAYRGYKTYQASGDLQASARVGLDTYGGLYFMGLGGCLILIGLLFGIFWAPFLLIGVAGVGSIALGWRAFSHSRQQYRAITSGQVHRIPPPTPGTELPPSGYTYGYDLATGRFTRTPVVPELPRGRAE